MLEIIFIWKIKSNWDGKTRQQKFLKESVLSCLKLNDIIIDRQLSLNVKKTSRCVLLVTTYRLAWDCNTNSLQLEQIWDVTECPWQVLLARVITFKARKSEEEHVLRMKCKALQDKNKDERNT